MNTRNYDLPLSKKDIEQMGYMQEREKSRAWVRRYIKTGNLSEFYIGDENELPDSRAS